MVDQAVLSLAKERPLDPLPNFIVERPTKMAARDTRNMAFGVIPLEEVPGGDEALDEWGTENNISVRKNFTPVPIYLPKVAVGAGRHRQDQGEASRLADRVQAARQGDQRAGPFRLRHRRDADPPGAGRAAGAAALRAAGRHVRRRPDRPRRRGAGRAGRATMAADGLELKAAAEQRFSWTQNRPARLDFPATVSEPAPGRQTVRLRFGLQRDADRAVRQCGDRPAGAARSLAGAPP